MQKSYREVVPPTHHPGPSVVTSYITTVNYQSQEMESKVKKKKDYKTIGRKHLRVDKTKILEIMKEKKKSRNLTTFIFQFNIEKNKQDKYQTET